MSKKGVPSVSNFCLSRLLWSFARRFLVFLYLSFHWQPVSDGFWLLPDCQFLCKVCFFFQAGVDEGLDFLIRGHFRSHCFYSEKWKRLWIWLNTVILESITVINYQTISIFVDHHNFHHLSLLLDVFMFWTSVPSALTYREKQQKTKLYLEL